jgi:mycothiol synthase
VGELTTRPYAPGDAVAVRDLLNAAELHAGGRAGWVASEIGDLVDALVADAATDTRLLHDTDGTLVAAALVGTPPPGGFRVDLLGGVHPDHLGRGVGRELLAWQYERAARMHADRDPDGQWQAEVGVISSDGGARRLFERQGFAVARYFFDMVASTAGPRAAALPDGLRAVPVTGDVAPALYEAHMEAFADHWGYQRRGYEAWLTLTLQAESFRPDLSRVAFDGGEIAGYLLAYVDADPERIYVGQVGTRRPWRGRGVASALLADVLTAAGAAGFAKVCLGVDAESPTGAVGVYARAGFAEEFSFVAYRKPIG